MKQPRSIGCTQTVHFGIEPEAHQQLVYLAQRRHMTVSQLLREQVRSLLAEYRVGKGSEALDTGDERNLL